MVPTSHVGLLPFHIPFHKLESLLGQAWASNETELHLCVYLCMLGPTTYRKL